MSPDPPGGGEPDCLTSCMNTYRATMAAAETTLSNAIAACGGNGPCKKAAILAYANTVRDAATALADCIENCPQ